MTRARGHIFVVNNWTPEEREALIRNAPKMRYIIFGEEVGKKCGTPHLQGYLYAGKQMSFKAVSKAMQVPRMAQKEAFGTVEQNKTYCSKEATNVFEHGDPPHQGKHMDLESAAEAVAAGASLFDICADNPALYSRNHRGLQAVADMSQDHSEQCKYTADQFNRPLETDFSKSIILHGPADCGKTQYALCHFAKPLFIRHLDDLKYFNQKGRYDGIVFDDMSFNHIPRSAQIHLLDQDNTSSIHIRYGTATIPAGTPKIFCTNEKNIFKQDDPAIDRRIRNITIDGKLF